MENRISSYSIKAGRIALGVFRIVNTYRITAVDCRTSVLARFECKIDGL